MTIVASNESDSLVVQIDDELGQLVAPTENWRGVEGDGEGFLQAMRFVEAYLSDSYGHLLTVAGEERLVAARDVPELVKGDPGARMRSWQGTLDREPS